MSFSSSIKALTGKLLSNLSEETPSIKPLGSLYSFYSPVGNTGVGSFVSNLANHLDKQGHTVLILDFNFSNPVCFSYFKFSDKDAYSSENSLLKYFSSVSYNPEESIHSVVHSNICVAGASLNNSIYDIIEVSYAECESLLQWAVAHFDYVLTRLDSNPNNEVTACCILNSQRTFSLVVSDVNQILSLGRYALHYQSLLSNNKIEDVLQSKCLPDFQFSEVDFKNIHLNLIANIPYSLSLQTLFANKEFVPEIGDSFIKAYNECIECVLTKMNGGASDVEQNGVAISSDEEQSLN